MDSGKSQIISQGSDCSKQCISGAGFWGVDCDESCPDCQNEAKCSVFTGKCECKSGFHGKLCENQCEKGYWGTNCANVCQCLNGADCNSFDGTCTCTPGFKGVFCDQTCNSWSYGEACSSTCACNQTTSQSCNHVTGECNCDSYWNGPACGDWICPGGNFGPHCDQNCTCVNEGTCESVSGKCLCPDGFEGKDCEKGKIYGFFLFPI